MGMSETLKAISDDDRRKILMMLKDGKKTAGEIANEFDLTNATVSYHLKKLKEAELVVETKYKNFIYYDINLSVFEEILVWINQISGGKNEK